jgi:hypothetical protein
VTGPPGQLAPPAARPRSRAHLQALDDANRPPPRRLALPCPACRPGARCDEHACDENLIAAYHQMARAAVAALQDGPAQGHGRRKYARRGQGRPS